ncbi:hypothetical protein HOLleu_01930 [Holothuria leucospilota]|uniref:Uncharacterized protein n=1 Tax=Holothuria leucospilota TaxID=206669 RepID=A0A9Q1HGQ5_HOLLE|nr:hypothetical protein HOLleu_01930 [Holothuria leucospilota]
MATSRYLEDQVNVVLVMPIFKAENQHNQMGPSRVKPETFIYCLKYLSTEVYWRLGALFGDVSNTVDCDAKKV